MWQVNTNEEVKFYSVEIFGYKSAKTTCFTGSLVTSCPGISPSTPWNSYGITPPPYIFHEGEEADYSLVIITVVVVVIIVIIDAEVGIMKLASPPI